MQLKYFAVPVIGGEWQEEEMNVFLRSKKVLQVVQELVQEAGSTFWCVSVKYIEVNSHKKAVGRTQKKVDYREVLDVPTFARFSKLREIRKAIAEKEAVPAFAILTNEEMAEMAKLKNLSLASMQTIKGVGEQKVKKYGSYFLTIDAAESTNEKSQ